VRVVIVENEALFLDLITDALRGRGIEVVGRAASQPEALHVIDSTAPDLAVLDIRLTRTSDDEGLRVAELVRARYPDVGLLALSAYLEPAYAERLLTMQEVPRAVGYLVKERVGNLDELVEAFARITRGEVVIDPYIISQLMSRRRVEDPLDRLSPHERRILALVAEGRSNLGIAQELKIKISTVERQLSSITDKLGIAQAADSDRRSVNVRVLAALTFLRSSGSHRPPGFPR
jgi:DNA-binding NarL/FixJ family response regulator